MKFAGMNGRELRLFFLKCYLTGGVLFLMTKDNLRYSSNYGDLFLLIVSLILFPFSVLVAQWLYFKVFNQSFKRTKLSSFSYSEEGYFRHGSDYIKGTRTRTSWLGVIVYLAALFVLFMILAFLFFFFPIGLIGVYLFLKYKVYRIMF